MSVIPDSDRESSKVFKAGVNSLTGLDLSPGLIMIKYMAAVLTPVPKQAFHPMFYLKECDRFSSIR